MKPLAVQRMGQAEHDGDIGVRSAGPPVRLHEVSHVFLERRDVHELRVRPDKPLELIRGGVSAKATVRDLGVLEGDAAETHHQFRFPGDVGNSGRLHHQTVEGHAEDVRNDHFGSASGVGGAGVNEPADQVQETLELPLGVVKAASAGPAVGAAEDRFIAASVDGPLERFSGQVKRGVPLDPHEGFAAAAGATGLPASLQPASAHHWRWHPAASVLCIEQRLANGGRIAVGSVVMHRRHAAVAALQQVVAPVRAGRRQVGGLCHIDRATSAVPRR